MTPAAFRGKNAVFPLTCGAGVRSRSRRSEGLFQRRFALKPPFRERLTLLSRTDIHSEVACIVYRSKFPTSPGGFIMRCKKFHSLLLLLLFMISSLPTVHEAWARQLLEGPLSPEQGKIMAEQQKDIFILDVRNPNEYAAAHYAGAINIPVAELKDRLGEVPTDKMILIHCAKGRRAERAYNLVKENRPDSRVCFIKGETLFK